MCAFAQKPETSRLVTTILLTLGILVHSLTCRFQILSSPEVEASPQTMLCGAFKAPLWPSFHSVSSSWHGICPGACSLATSETGIRHRLRRCQPDSGPAPHASLRQGPAEIENRRCSSQLDTFPSNIKPMRRTSFFSFGTAHKSKLNCE
jgi:hypothetical protein